MIDQAVLNIYNNDSIRIESNIPNLLNYARFLILIYVMKIMSTSPFKSFFFTWLAGSLDMIDGYFARKYNHISKFGAMLDFGMDRLTTIMQFFYLSSVYPKFWFIFLSINSVELIRDILLSNLNLYKSLLILLELVKGDNNTINKIKEVIYESLGLKYPSELNNTLQTVKNIHVSSTTSTSTNQYFVEYFNFYIWYSSDVFFWLIYFASFITLAQNTLPSNKLDEHITNIRMMRKHNLTKRFKLTIQESLIFFDQLANFIQSKLHFSNNKDSRYNFNNLSPIIKITIACLIRFFIFACLIGSLLRFLTNLNALINCLFDIIQMDYKKIQLTLL
jgi:phosphatidylglycerophosphate synthase